ncbi:Rft-1-domain-containing protein [Flagelloscypha sp. PMI_526]|nr:Rft-1-domain-containing protein [Flagelloscypha sp. PMI_526]
MAKALSTLLSLVFLQLSSRLLTFGLNQFLIRLTTPKAYGTASIQFELLSSTILFLGREGVRNAVLRAKSNNKEVESLNVVEQDWFYHALAIYVFAALLELITEPGHNHSMVNEKTHLRVRAEGLGVTLKTVSTTDLPLIAYATGQLIYASTVLTVYLQSLKLTPSSPILRLSLTMTSQSIVKHFLTEGDKILISLFARVEDQGGYAIAVNYGSLIARIVFQPIEETLRLYFSKKLPPPDAKDESKKTVVALEESRTTLSTYLATSAPQILRAYILYIPFLSVNGGLEAFVSSASSSKDLNRQSSYMVLFSILYTISTIALYSPYLPFNSPGDSSLVYANIVNLTARIIFALSFCSRYFKTNSPLWMSLVPSPTLLGLIRYILPPAFKDVIQPRLGLYGLKGAIVELGLGGVFALVWLGLFWLTDGKVLVRQMRSAVSRRDKVE